jgi:hypothetical protein
MATAAMTYGFEANLRQRSMKVRFSRMRKV